MVWGPPPTSFLVEMSSRGSHRRVAEHPREVEVVIGESMPTGRWGSNARVRLLCMLSKGLGISLVASLLYVAKFFEFDKSVADRTRWIVASWLTCSRESLDWHVASLL